MVLNLYIIRLKYVSKINNIEMSENNLVEEVMVNYLSRLLTNKVLNNLDKKCTRL